MASEVTKDDASGTRGGKTEYIGKVEMTWPLELFERNSILTEPLCEGNAAEINYAKSIKGLQDSARTTWITYQSAQSRVSYISPVEMLRFGVSEAQKRVVK